MKTFAKNLMAFILSVMALSLTACGELSNTAPAPPGEVAAVDQTGYVQLQDPLAIPGATLGEACTDRNYLIVLDASGSMAGSPIEQAKEAICTYVRNLPQGKQRINLAFVYFQNDQIVTAVPFGSSASNNREELVGYVNQVEAGGGTPLVDAIDEGTNVLLKQCQKQLNYGDYRMIVVTDGEPTGRTDLDTVCSRAASFGFSIYTIGFNIGDGHPLKNWATSYETADSAASLAQKLQNTAAEPNEYVPTYSPTK